jgi:adenosylcobinamide-phosphate synthase
VTPITALAAFLIERTFGDASMLARPLGHPVAWMGALIDRLDARLNDPALAPATRRRRGILALAVLVAASLLPATALVLIVRPFPFGWLAEALLAAPFLASTELERAVGAVAAGLRQSLAAGRAAVSHIVGRDLETLDAAGVARAGIESLAENSSDGVIAPLVYLLIFGLPGIVAYKAVNTADSMLGHRDDRYRDFGWASARTDDIANLVPARLTAALYALAAWTLPGFDGPGAWRAARRDAPSHVSVNAGWPEAAMAGALCVSLGGPRTYGGRRVDLPEMGQGRRRLTANDIDRALRLDRAVMVVVLVLLVPAAVLIVLP